MKADFYRQQHRKTMCVTTWSLPIDVRFFVSRVQRYDFFRKVVTYTASIFSIV